MQFSTLAVFAAAALGVSASRPAHNGTVKVVTETLTALTTYCPEPTTITYGDHTYTVTEPTTLTITGPCTITRPVTVVSSVVCDGGCDKPAAPTYPAKNATVPVAHPTGSHPGPAATKPAVVQAGAGRVAALSGAGLAGVLGLAAFML
ncbi:hypothetical protein QBC39DRAFT_435921 [Podospora conica]|nr:hypothetical protein QBC39DRAFT_435921 [Schizothecium conicum]